MDAQQQSLLAGFDAGFDPDGLSQPAAESTGVIEEISASEDPPASAYPVGGPSSTTGKATPEHGPALHEPDAQGTVEEDTDGSEPPEQASSSEEVVLEYQISTWALLSPEMDPEQLRLLEEDIERNGVAAPVDVLDGEVLDGRHREAARRKTGRPPNYNFLQDDTDVVSHLLSRNGLRGHHDENERAIYAYKLWRHQFVVAGIEPGTSSANLRNFQSQEQIARLLNVSPRSVSSVASVLGPRSTAISVLKDAVEKRQIKASDAQRVLTRPAKVQRQAVDKAVGGGARTVLAAARMVEQENSRREALRKKRSASSASAVPSITIFQAAVSEMTGRVPQESVDAIISFPSPNPSLHGLFEELAVFAAHALRPAGVMAVLTSGLQLPSVIQRLSHPDLKWVAEFDYRPPKPSQSGPPLSLTLKRWPLLIYGKRRYHLQGGDDVIDVSGYEGLTYENTGGQRLEDGIAMIMDRLTVPGQLVCDPIMLGRSDSAIAAWITGRGFIGATDAAGNLSRIRAGLSSEGVPFQGD